jgi:hypothetical protein
MPTCSVCGNEAAATDAFCQTCGASMTRPETPTMVPPTVAAPTPPSVSVPQAHGPGQAGHGAAAGRVATRSADQLLGTAQPNQMYLGHRLVYEASVAESFDPLGPTFFRELRYQAGMIWLMSVILAVIPLILFVAGGALRVLGVIGLLIAFPGLWIYFWFHPISAAKSEWKLLIDDRGSVADEVFGHITWAFKRRNSPVDKLKVKRVSPGGGGAKRDYLEIRDGIFAGFISAFPYGEDLYIGWVMYWNLSPFRWLIARLRRMYLALTGRDTYINWMYRYEYAKAMRETIHSAAREGVDAAVGAVSYQEAGTIGSDLEVEVVASMTDVPAFATGGSTK